MMMNEAFDSLRGIHEFLAMEIYEGTLSPELANDVLFGRKKLDDAYAEYEHDIMEAMYEEYAADANRQLELFENMSDFGKLI